MVEKTPSTRDQFDLFPKPKKRKLTAAEIGKQDGMQRSERHANAAWATSMLEAILLTCRTCKRFNTDYVMKIYSGAEATHDLRAMGPLMRRAAKMGWCKKANCAPVNSTRASLHASPRTMWDSLIYQGGKEAH